MCVCRVIDFANALDIATFSLECDGFFIPDVQKSPKEISDDPFDVLDVPLSQNHDVLLDPRYSDISDDEDLQVPCSQKHLPSS